MRVKEKTLQSLALEMYNNLETATRQDDTKYYRTKETIKWQRDIIYKAHEGSMPRDYIYSFIYDAVSAISEAESNSDLDEIIYSIEPSIYTNELTAWLNCSNNNVYYLTDALQEYETKDGFQLLMLAYSKCQ